MVINMVMSVNHANAPVRSVFKLNPDLQNEWERYNCTAHTIAADIFRQVHRDNWKEIHYGVHGEYANEDIFTVKNRGTWTDFIHFYGSGKLDWVKWMFPLYHSDPLMAGAMFDAANTRLRLCATVKSTWSWHPEILRPAPDFVGDTHFYPSYVNWDSPITFVSHENTTSKSTPREWYRPEKDPDAEKVLLEYAIKDPSCMVEFREKQARNQCESQAEAACRLRVPFLGIPLDLPGSYMTASPVST